MILLRKRLMLLLPLVLAGCGRLADLASTTRADQWCEQRPCIDVGGRIVSEPWSTGLVFALALLWLASGAYFLITRRAQRSRTWLGIALLLGGVGAALAGTSYQALGYELKCAGFEVCRLTDGFEVGYSITQAASVSAMLVAVAYAVSAPRARRGICWYAGINVAAYLIITALGIALPSAFLLSFSLLMLFALPGVVLVIVLAARRYLADRDPLSRDLLIAALLLVVVQVAYFAYYAAGVTAVLYRGGGGVYFSENDVLHVGMIVWLGYVVFAVGRHLGDRPGLGPAESIDGGLEVTQ